MKQRRGAEEEAQDDHSKKEQPSDLFGQVFLFVTQARPSR
jgi:hypothetical protein